MNQSDKILVTAANGNTGFPAAKTLLEMGFQVRAFVRNDQNPKALKLREMGAEIFSGNIEDIRDTRRALIGVKRAYFVPVYPNVLFQGETFATAAEEAGLEHIVLLTQWISSNTHPSSYTKEHWLVDQTFKRLPTVQVTLLNPGLFAFPYFLALQIMAQFGIMPEFGSNAPPSNEDIGAVAAHILKSPEKHTGKIYRVTGREMLTTQQKANIIGKVLGRNVRVEALPIKMMLKVFKADGFPVRDYSQLRYYIEDARNNVFSKGGVTTVVKDIVGREAEDFETIAKRYIQQSPAAQQSLSNKLRAMVAMIKVILTSLPNLDRYESQMGFPKFKNMTLSSNSKEWASERQL